MADVAVDKVRSKLDVDDDGIDSSMDVDDDTTESKLVASVSVSDELSAARERFCFWFGLFRLDLAFVVNPTCWALPKPRRRIR